MHDHEHNHSHEHCCHNSEHTHKHEHDHGCCHTHEHNHDHSHSHGHEHCCCHRGSSNHKVLFARLGVSAVLLALIMIGEKFFGIFDLLFSFLNIENSKIEYSIKLVFYLIPYLTAGFDILWGAIKNIFHGEVFDEAFLMSTATIGALAIGEFPEASFVMIFYQIGEFFSDYSAEKTRSSIKELINISPQFALVMKDGEFVKVSPESVSVGTEIYVRAGEKIPLDSIVLEGQSTINTAALTGESIPEEIYEGSQVFSGSINLTSLLKLKTTKVYKDSMVSKILELVEKAENKKSKAENFITKFSKIYTPCVVIGAVLLAVIPPLVQIFAKIGFNNGVAEIPYSEYWTTWIHRALIFLVVSCPCALVISVPLSFFVGIGRCAKNGILIKGGNYLESLSKAKICIFDKTGTLTKGRFCVTDIFCQNSNQSENAEIIKYAAACEIHSTHPISLAIVKNYEERNPLSSLPQAKKVTEVAGQGIIAQIEDKTVLCGNIKLLKENGFSQWEQILQGTQKLTGTAVYIAVNSQYLGYIEVHDEVKTESKDTVNLLKKLGIEQNIMLTGDKQNAALSVAQELGLDNFFAELFPQDKLNILENIYKGNPNGSLVFCGDGINDAPVLMRSDVGISMGSLGSDAAIEASDAVIMDDDISKVPLAIKMAKSTNKIAKENICFSLAIKIAVLVLGALGLANMWYAILADVGVLILATLNATRAGKV